MLVNERFSGSCYRAQTRASILAKSPNYSPGKRHTPHIAMSLGARFEASKHRAETRPSREVTEREKCALFSLMRDTSRAPPGPSRNAPLTGGAGDVAGSV